MRRSFVSIAFLALGIVTMTGCATKGYVKSHVGEVNQKVDTLTKSVEQTQERTRANEGKISEVDSKAVAAGSAAADASRAASAADLKAGAADMRAGAAGSAAADANSKAADLDRASRRLVYTVVLSEDQGKFSSGKADLPTEAKAKIDDLVTQLKADPKGAYFEIEGHTDSTGDKLTNDRLGLERAEAVKKYLYDQHQIPLFKMNVISYGAEKPVASNKTKDGRAQNRRVVIKVLI